jgi:hypothetical protein
MRERNKLPPISSIVKESRYCVLSSDVSAHGEDVELLMAGWEPCGEDYLIRREGYPSLALELVAAGKEYFR